MRWPIREMRTTHPKKRDSQWARLGRSLCIRPFRAPRLGERRVTQGGASLALGCILFAFSRLGKEEVHRGTPQFCIRSALSTEQNGDCLSNSPTIDRICRNGTAELSILARKLDGRSSCSGNKRRLPIPPMVRGSWKKTLHPNSPQGNHLNSPGSPPHRRCKEPGVSSRLPVRPRQGANRILVARLPVFIVPG
jgi:hypothetical protein